MTLGTVQTRPETGVSLVGRVVSAMGDYTLTTKTFSWCSLQHDTGSCAWNEAE